MSTPFPSLYETLVEARRLYDARTSQYICDCISTVEDNERAIRRLPHDYDNRYTQPLIDFVLEDIEHNFGVEEYLFPSRNRWLLSPEQLAECRAYREGLWTRLFDHFAEAQS